MGDAAYNPVYFEQLNRGAKKSRQGKLS